MPQDTAEGKGYIRYKLIDVVFNPSVTACHLPYMANATPRNATGHGKGRSLKVNCPKKLDKLHLTESVSSYS